MSAEVLRRAAALMRERAEMAPDGPWGFTSRRVVGGSFSEVTNRVGVVVETIGDGGDAFTANYISSMHPAVALAVADWLEATAREFDALNIGSLDGHPLDGRRTGALAVARAYLGEQA